MIEISCISVYQSFLYNYINKKGDYKNEKKCSI